MAIDLRSDTVTKPTKAMLEAMWSAEVGDDVFAEDASINALESKVAKLFGHEAALFCPSGTMTNQIAIKVHTQPGDEVICHGESHIFRYEGGGIAANSGAQAYLLQGPRGTFTLQDVQAAVHPADSHYPRTGMVAVENTTNRGGGATWSWDELQKISTWLHTQDIPFHVDGARIFNAMVATKMDAKRAGQLFDSISVCFSKGLGCPVGSALIGSKDFIKKAHRIRKRMGGGMRQAGYLAKACEFALDNHVNRLAEDHQKAKFLAIALQACEGVVEAYPTETNIVIFETANPTINKKLLDYLAKKDIMALAFGPKSIRFVTHLDLSSNDIDFVVQTLKSFKA
ncbi:MAG: threonine aldolase family protein [Luteibaculum sp.]